jgi:hypothetical protein
MEGLSLVNRKYMVDEQVLIGEFNFRSLRHGHHVRNELFAFL